MPLRMWMYDLAREQTPTLDHWRTLCRLSLDSGYDALGLNLEHWFRYPSAPWAAGRDCLHTETVKILEQEFPDLQIIPFINLLGHFEGFLYTEGGQGFAEENLLERRRALRTKNLLSLRQVSFGIPSRVSRARSSISAAMRHFNSASVQSAKPELRTGKKRKAWTARHACTASISARFPS